MKQAVVVGLRVLFCSLGQNLLASCEVFQFSFTDFQSLMSTKVANSLETGLGQQRDL